MELKFNLTDYINDSLAFDRINKIIRIRDDFMGFDYFNYNELMRYDIDICKKVVRQETSFTDLIFGGMLRSFKPVETVDEIEAPECVIEAIDKLKITLLLDKQGRSRNKTFTIKCKDDESAMSDHNKCVALLNDILYQSGRTSCHITQGVQYTSIADQILSLKHQLDNGEITQYEYNLARKKLL